MTEDLDRESIWSVRHTSITPYLVTFGILFAGFTGLFFWREFANAQVDSNIIDIVLAAWLKSCAGAIGEAVAAMYLVEVWNMLSEKYLRRRYREGLEEGRQEGRQEGMEEGESAANRRWLAWLQRREEAERAGRDFDEPPPAEPRDRK